MGRWMEGMMGEILYNNGDVEVVSGEARKTLITYTDGDEGVVLTRDEAIAAARSILKHFNAGMEE